MQNSVATLYNKAFLVRQYEEDGEYIVVGDKRIEKEILRDAVSTKSCKKKNNSDKIIFPYRNYAGGYERISETEMQQLYPHTLDYMRQYRTKLSKRKSSDGVLWYE